MRAHANYWQTCLQDGDQAPGIVQHPVALILAKYRGEYDHDTCYQGSRSWQALGERKKRPPILSAGAYSPIRDKKNVVFAPYQNCSKKVVFARSCKYMGTLLSFIFAFQAQ